MPDAPVCWLSGCGEGSAVRAEQEREYVEFVRARAVTLRRLAYRLCGDWHAAEDLVQKAFVLLYRHWRRASAAASLDAYVRTMLVNVYLDDRRGWWARRVATVAVPPDFATVTAESDGRIDLMAALARISPGQRAVLVLRFWEQLNVAETAEALGCSTGTVKSQTSVAIAALRRLLPDYVSENRIGDPPA
jgi:RNA polymerase sigma-70 factor (sigma-E family)